MSQAIPRVTHAAVLLIGAAYLAGIAKWAWFNDWAHPVVDSLQLAVGTLALAWALSRLRLGSRPWRWVYVLFLLWGVVDLTLWPPAAAPLWETVFAVAQLVLQCAGTVLLFTPASNLYFRSGAGGRDLV